MSSSFHPAGRSVRRAAGLAVGAALAAASLVACSPAGGGTADGSASITVWTWEQPGEGMSAAVPAFEKEHPDITVTVENVGNPAIWDKITTGMAAGGSGLADVMTIGGDYMGNYLETFPDGFANLSDMGADDLADDFPSGLWGTGANSAGDQYGIPFEVNTSLVFYRSDLFEAAGLDGETIETWDEMLDAGIAIKEATGADLFAIDKAASQADAANTWQMLVRLLGGYFFDADGDITMNSPEGVEALEFLQRANDAGIIADVPQSDGLLPQIQGQVPVALIPSASWLASNFEKDAPEMEGKWAVRRPPAMEAGGFTSASSGGTFLTVAGSSPNKEAAYEFVEFAMATLEGQQLVFEGGGLFPSYAPMWETPEFAAPSDYFGGLDINALIVSALQEDTPPDYYTKDYAKALKAFTDAQTQVLISGADPREALDAAAELLASQTGRELAG